MIFKNKDVLFVNTKNRMNYQLKTIDNINFLLFSKLNDLKEILKNL